MNDIPYNIAAVERDTGLSKDVLRVWERRYGFPQPDRDTNGDRLYPTVQVERLRLIKRLMDQGHRPGKLLALNDAELATLPTRHKTELPDDPAAISESELDELLEPIRRHHAANYLMAMQQRLARQGMLGFVEDTIAPLTDHVGKAWESGVIEVFEEHLYTELTMRLLRQAIATLPARPQGRRILLTTVPDERHALGLLMVEAVLSIEGAHCIPLGPQMPLIEIARAAEAHQVEVVALSFSSAFPQRQITGLLQQLETLLPAGIELWAGGAGVANLPKTPGIRFISTLASARQALDA
ncbi:MAG: MerR family transcriptional regulator [Rhodocyclaceae bacterium]|nr:MerR family transcriptional regulator [Rhodocyclaceae bacterium]